MLPDDKKRALARELSQIAGSAHVITSPVELEAYGYDASLESARPDLVVLPASTAEVAEIVRLACAMRVPVVARGAGTSVSGGSVPVEGGVMIAFSRMNRILEIDPENLCATVEPGVVNLDLSRATAPHGLRYLPDPSSQKTCTLGGNVAENAGGLLCFRYGVTVNHVTGLELVTADGEICQIGGKAPGAPGYDLLGVLTGSEGTLGIFTKITVRLMPLPRSSCTVLASYGSVDEASATVAEVVASGIVPAALEMMDREIIHAVEAYVGAGYPLDAEAVLIMELEGDPRAVEAQAVRIDAICKRNQAREVRLSRDAEERERLWSGRKGALGAVARLRPRYYLHDGVVPRSRLVGTLREVQAIGKRYRLQIVNVFHAGDGNLHPMILFDTRDADETARVRKAGDEIIRACVAAGGTITGEHGIGIEKRHLMPLIFTPDDLSAMARLKHAFDPDGLLNPGKIFPTGALCGDVKPVAA
ncbi:MAG: FAD-linked oxidase C-terminal domain-containing protein [Deltaproteobacteria bacterium]|nr:FAD-linked oxidase C-terminal domain-containing protein [Deltaproteobacteria bacterium]